MQSAHVLTDILNVLPDLLVAMLAAWLGAIVLSRSPRDYPSLVFGLLTLLAAIWGASRVVYRLSTDTDGSVRAIADSVTAGVATLLPAALLHMVLAFTIGRRPSLLPRLLLLLAYGMGLLMGYLSVSDRSRPIAINPPNRELLGLPGYIVGWGWMSFRVLVMAAAIWWAWRAWRAEGPGGPRRDQLGATLAAVTCGALGGALTIFARQLVGVEWEWFGTTLVAVALALAMYAVIGQRILLSPTAVRRSFYSSVGAGLITAAYVLLIYTLERYTRSVLEIQASLVTAISLVLTIALFDPVRERFRAIVDRRSERKDVAYRRLLRAMGGQLLTSQRPENAIRPALEQLCRTLGTRAAAVISADGNTIAAHGAVPAPDATFPLSLPLRAGGQGFGRLVLGPKRSRLPYTPEETELLQDAAGFIAASLHLAERQAAQALALEALTQERTALATQETRLTEALQSAGSPEAEMSGLRVYALGPLRVERDGEAIRNWGGAKAGTRQAEAMFAFLFDRADRGVAKDEFIEVVWPDVPLEKADLAFHRTLGGLRRMLEPSLKKGNESRTVIYQNDRYRLGRAVVEWSDVSLFEDLVSRGATDQDGGIASLEEARGLYRGPYLDDCPFYGDSLYVEERRSLLEGRYIDLLLALGEQYEKRGDPTAAAACFRQALKTAQDDCPRADDGLARLGLPV